jgi:hypothetical protein
LKQQIINISKKINQTWLYILFAVILLAVASTCVDRNIVYAETKTWDGGGTDANWSTAENWNPDGVPAVGDDIIFSSGKSSTIDGSFNNEIGSLTISGYSNIITLSNDLSLSGDFSQSSGTISYSSGTLTVGGGLTHSGGTFGSAINPVVLLLDGSSKSISHGASNFLYRFNHWWFVICWVRYRC